jgi:PEP-CTERM motif
MKRTLKTLIVLAAAFAGFASVANAASVVLSSDKGEYVAGETIFLTATVTAAPGETDINLFGVVLYSSARVAPVPGTNLQTNYPGGFSGAANPACTTVQCRQFNQIAFPNPVPGTGANFVIGTMQFTASGPPGTVVTFNWLTTGTQRLDFFGVSQAPGVTVTIIPEPTTAAMLGIGLFGLAMAGRRRA